MPKNPYQGQLRRADFMAADVTLGAAGAWIKIGSYTVPASTALELGLGDLTGQDNAQGRLYIDIIDDTAGNATPEDGLLRIEARGPQGRPIEPLKEITTVAARSGDADTRANQISFPRTYTIIPEDWTIELWMKPDAASDVVSYAYCTILIDCIKYDLV